MASNTKMTGDFSAKPQTRALAERITALVETLGPSEKAVKGQLSLARKRKFLWLWTYGHTADGMLYLTVCLERKLENPNFHYVTEVSPNRWNHHVVVRSPEQIDSSWFRDLIEAGYVFGGG